ncbi:YchJ family metal-binding protein [Pseudoxanthomonas sp. CF125]|uniref:YchJ family protein n=1 Tax=Pseudoxanthomonas sp. CF125 TaxID=1855303 RepID=UPI00088A3D29|nr:YchJ family metal-binding protein [Pseudoxanthomonas sp. CF125]SDR14857.1 SEC-C motif-containing protein [Pseudoxanthomonas sp. CF125]
MAASSCPCGSDRDYSQCCRLLHDGAPAADAEALMRSRYSAYALGLGQYLLDSWHASTRPVEFDLDAADPPATWLGLSVKRHQRTSADTAEVEFIARYRVGGGSAVRLHERSRFQLVHGHWFYLDGQHL